MAKTGFTMNFSDFDAKFKKIMEKAVPELAGQGLFQAGALIIRDAITETPKAPHLKGHLVRSQKVLPPKDTAKSIEVTVGFNVPYAARLHEAPNNWNWTLQGSGPKFLEAKLSKNKDKYMKKAAAVIKGGAK